MSFYLKRTQRNPLAWTMISWLLVCAVLASPLPAESAAKNILLLYSQGNGNMGIWLFHNGLTSALNANGIGSYRLYYEFLDADQGGMEKPLRSSERDRLLAKYAQQDIDLLITVEKKALDFLQNEGKQIAPGAPALVLDNRMPASMEVEGRRVVRQKVIIDIKGTLERALELFPQTRRVVIAAGRSEADQRLAAQAVRIATALPAKLEIETTGELALDDLLKRVAILSPHTIILLLTYSRDINSHDTFTYAVEEMLIKAANAPLFHVIDFNLIGGGIGGSVINFKGLGEKTGQTALAILDGKLPLAQPVTRVDYLAKPIFNWSQIQRWGGDANRLPDNSLFLNRPPTLWEQHKFEVLGLALVFLLQSSTIITLLRNKRRRRRVEQDLRESELQFRTLADSGQALIWLSGTDKLCTYVNRVWLDFTGRSLEQEMGNGWAEGVHPDDFQHCLEVYVSSFDRREKFSMDYRLRRYDGEYRWLQDDGCPRYNRDGEFIGYIGYCLDITDRKQIEEKLREYQTQLEVMVQQRTAELSSALAAAQLADRTKDEFLANISHELRTPLNAVIGLSGLALDRATDPKQRDYLDKIATSGKHLARIVNDLLDLSKIAAGRMEFEAISFSLRQLVLRGNSVMAQKAAEKGLTLVEQVDDAVPDHLVGDPLRLEQILLNLLSNAIKFTASGGVEVHIGLHAREAHRVCLDIEVKDSGIGMRQQELEQLFKPFSQADASMSRKYGGTGLGLTISRRLAEMMDGDINVDSREGSGTTFRVRLWLGLAEADDQPAAVPSAAQEEITLPPCYRNARVLVVEDQAMNREIVDQLLSSVGIAARMAGNGQEALDILGKTGPTGFDLILMDIQMPVMDGLTATRAIRAQAGFEKLPIIAMSAHTMKHEIKMGTAAGMNDHIGKPFDNAGFYRILAQWIPREKHQAPLSSPFKGEAGRGMGSEAAKFIPIPSPTLPLKGREKDADALKLAFMPLKGEEVPVKTGEEPSIDTAAGLARFAGNESRYHHWLANFVAEAPGYASEIRQSLAAGQQDTASKSAHAFKGRVGMLGMNDLHAVLAALEAALKQGEPTEELLARLERAVDQASHEIKAALGNRLPPEPPLSDSRRKP